MKRVILIAAMGENNRVIGNMAGTGMPWDIPEEFEHFLGLVRGKPVIMGRKSFDIFKAQMPGSPLFVVSRQKLSYPQATVCPNIDSAISLANQLSDDVFVAGGEELYRLALPLAHTLFLSTIHGTYEGKARFPRLPEKEWKLDSSIRHPRFIFEVFQRIF